MPDSERGAHPWLAERGAMSPGGESANGTETGNGTEPRGSTEPADTDGAEAQLVADSIAAMSDSAREPAVPFLQSLVDAMRKIADQTRDDALAKLRASVTERSAEIRAETEKRAAELHELADADLASVADWEQGEIQRIREEAATKVSARNATLDAQLAANVAAGEGAMTAVEARVDAFEAEMNSFFAQLNDVQDPAALASALKRIPQAPALTDAVAAPAGDTAPSPAATAPAEPEEAAVPDVSGEAATSAPVAEPATETPVSAAPEPVMHGQGALAAGAAAATAAEVPSAVATAEPVVEPAVEPVVEAAAPVEEPLAAEAPFAGPVEEATTQVLVTGLTSFGAITTFKQSLEHVPGIVRVSLGLGTSGEFIFTAVHHAGFDLTTAIRSFEESAQFVASNGQLRVTVGPKA